MFFLAYSMYQGLPTFCNYQCPFLDLLKSSSCTLHIYYNFNILACRHYQ